MHYRLTGDTPQEEHILAAHPEARVLFDPFIPALTARAITAAARLGVFDAIGTETRELSDLTEALSLDSDTLELLMRVLASAGYVAMENGKYSLTELSRETLRSGGSRPLWAWARFNRVHWSIIDDMEDVLKTGIGGDIYRHLKDESDWKIMQEAMLETARPICGVVASQVPVSQSSDMLLDIGGSHGLYGAMICRLHPPMRSVVLELAEAVESARSLAKAEGIDDVVSHVSGDVTDFNPGKESYDVVFMGNIIHHFTEAQNKEILGRIRDALTRGGTAAIWDFRRPEDDRVPDAIGDGFALLFRLSSSSRLYRESEMTKWMRDTGFSDVRVHPGPSPSHVLITGRKE